MHDMGVGLYLQQCLSGTALPEVSMFSSPMYSTAKDSVAMPARAALPCLCHCMAGRLALHACIEIVRMHG